MNRDQILEEAPSSGLRAQILEEASRLLAAKYKILNRDQAYYLLADRYADVIDQALADGTTDPRAIVRICQDELRSEADWHLYNASLEAA